MATGESRSGAGDRSLLRRINSLAILDILRQGPLTITQVATRTGLTRPSVDAVLRDLIELGWAEVDEVSPPRSGNGRPSRTFRFRAEAGHVLGVDIGAHTARVAVADLSARTRQTASTALHEAMPPAERVAAASALIDRCLGDLGLQRCDISALTIGTTGVVGATAVEHSTDLPGWQGFDLAESLGAEFTCDVMLRNDCMLAAVAEREYGVAAGVDDLVFILAGPRTGLGMVIGGRLHLGHTGAAGELGALPELGWLTAPRNLERMASAGRPLTPEEIFVEAERGDSEAIRSVDAYADALALGISAICLALDPEMVVVGGGRSLAGDTLLGPLRRHVERRIIRKPQIVASHLGSDAALIGAVVNGADHMRQRIASIANASPRLPSARGTHAAPPTRSRLD